ncbi:hypothetical protein [Lysobacter sp. Root690]|uniref:hypothetical protein n=1 Tax=Lysobacter sp. Root690 TaxID=1736588 RepID=UPI0012F9D4BF|nr:hypothetical protein [Lysobacter sp. Root690]
MDDRSGSNDSISDFARFVSAEIVENYRKEHSGFTWSAEVVDLLAKALVDTYRDKESALSTPAQPETGESSVMLTSLSNEPVFPLDFDVDVKVGSLHGQVTNPGDGEYLLTATFKIANQTVDTTKIRFKDGVLSRTEEIELVKQKVSLTFTIDFSDGFHISIEGHVKIAFINFHIGPYRFP